MYHVRKPTRNRIQTMQDDNMAYAQPQTRAVANPQCAEERAPPRSQFTPTTTVSAFPKISVVVPVYNLERYLAECLDSIINQTFKDFEIICVNDGSVDGSLKILEQYAAKDSRIRIISQENCGLSAARNAGIAVANAELIYPLDSDDIIAPNCLEDLHGIIAVTGCAVAAGEVESFGDGLKQSRFPQPKFTKYQMYGRHGHCVANALYRKSDWRKYGGYCVDGTFRATGGEDIDFWLHFIDDNRKMIRSKNVLLYYRMKPKAETFWRNYSRKQRRQNDRTKTRLLLRRHPKMFWWWALYSCTHYEVRAFCGKLASPVLSCVRFVLKKTCLRQTKNNNENT